MKKIILTLLIWCVGAVCASAQTQSDAVFEAAKNNNTQIISNALDNGMSIDAITENGATLLFFATQNQSYDVVELLIQRGANVNYVNEQAIGATPLMIAASRANINLAELLLDSGAGIDVVDVNNDPAINWAAYYGYTDMVEFLISRGASADIAGHGTPRQIAIRRGHQDLVELLSDYTPTDDELALIRAVEEENLDAFEQALADGASPDSLDATGRPIIGMLARLGLSEYTQALINAGAEVDRPDDIGFTPLMEAARDGQAETANLLLTAGANANHRSEPSALGFFPMHVAALSDNREVVELLLAFGADTDPRDRDSATPLIWALSERKLISSVRLLELGADPHIKNVNGYSSADVIAAMDNETLSALVKPQ